MATLKLTAKTTVAEVKKAFNESFGSQIVLFKRYCIAKDIAVLSDLGLKKDCKLDCSGNLTVGDFIKNMEEIGLKATVWTKDFNAKALDGLTLEETGNKVNDDKSGQEEVGEMNTYYLRVDANHCWRFETIPLKVDDDDVAEGFEYEDPWTQIVGETGVLSYLKEDLDLGEEIDGYDEDVTESLNENILEDESSLHVSHFFPDAEKRFNIVVLNDKMEEIETVKDSDITTWGVAQCYGRYEDTDEEYSDEEMSLILKYINNHQEDAFSKTPAFPVPEDADKWYWLNAQDCNMEEYAIYKLEIPGKFDPAKLLLKSVCIEECVGDMLSAEVITTVIYDGKILDLYDYAEPNYAYSTNFIIKEDPKSNYPRKIYNMSTREEREFDNN